MLFGCCKLQLLGLVLCDGSNVTVAADAGPKVSSSSAIIHAAVDAISRLLHGKRICNENNRFLDNIGGNE